MDESGNLGLCLKHLFKGDQPQKTSRMVQVRYARTISLQQALPAMDRTTWLDGLRGIAVIPKSNNPGRLAQNLDVVSFDLTQARD
ncbi:hypothetical protein NM208_g9878 [Fusarium decemcellulare]|uniref:Uncharacterized protein n=1 Tax=Fusarium decemcellulare TaxID=57161 RepID=A0ACC1RZW7_9HYPO|nr:hypothetical protein NM208_g9878 [Fusarium decemcellulare]